MPDSPSEPVTNPDTTPDPQEGGKEQKPKNAEQRISQLSGQKKDAEKQVDQLRQGLLDDDMKAAIADLIKEQVAPHQEQAEILRMALKSGMNEDQAKAVRDLQVKHGLNADEASSLARMRNPDLFPAAPQKASLRSHLGLASLSPTGDGASLDRPRESVEQIQQKAAGLPKDQRRAEVLRGLRQQFSKYFPS